MQRSILSGVLSVAGTKVLTLVVGILTTPVLYRLLQPAGVGVYTTVLSVFSLFMIFVSSGVSDGVRKFVAEDRARPYWESNVVGFYFRLAFVLAVAGSGLLALSARSGLVTDVFGPDFELYFYVLAVLVVTDQFREYARRTLMGFGLERYSEPLKVLQQLTFVGVALPLVYFDYGVVGALAGKIAAGATVAAIGLVLIGRRVSLKSVVQSTPPGFPRRQMLTFNSLSIVLILLLMSLYHVDILMLQFQASSEQVGYYRAALKLAEFLWFVPLALQTVFVHSTSELWSNGRTGKISELAARTTRYNFLLTGLMALGLAALADVAVPIYFGTTYTPAVTPLLFLLPGALGFAVARPILAISQGKGDLKFPILATGSAAVLNLGLNALLIPRYGMAGAAAATSVGYGSMAVFHFWSARRVGFDPLSDARLGRVVVTTVLAAIPIFAVSRRVDAQILVDGTIPATSVAVDVALPVSLVVVPPLGLTVYLLFAFLTGALGVCEVLETLSSFPEPVGSRAETLRQHTKNMSFESGSESVQKLLVVAGVLLFVTGIGFAALDPGVGLGTLVGDDSSQSPNAGPSPGKTTTGATTTQSPGGTETSTTPGGSTTSPEASTTPPGGTTSNPPSTTDSPPSTTTTTTTTSQPTTTTTTSRPSTTSTTTTTTTTSQPTTTTTTTTATETPTTTTSQARTTTTPTTAGTSTTTNASAPTVGTNTTTDSGFSTWNWSWSDGTTTNATTDDGVF